MDPILPTIDDVHAAAARIDGLVHRTPVLQSTELSRLLGADVWFKCENLQKVGAFKARGATNAVYALPQASAVAGVATHSSVNHAALSELPHSPSSSSSSSSSCHGCSASSVKSSSAIARARAMRSSSSE